MKNAVEALKACVAAMKKSQDAGNADHLDCGDDGGAFWYDAIGDAKSVIQACEGEWHDTPLPEDEEIDKAYPTRSGRHDTFAVAMRLVGASHSKSRLVSLVNWLLVEREKEAVRDHLGRPLTAHDVMKNFAMILGWGNVPPFDSLCKDLRILKARAESKS